MIIYKTLVSNIDSEDPTGANIIALDEHKLTLVGSLGLQLSAPSGFINSLFVAELYRGQGIGRELILRASHVAADSGKKTLGLTVNSQNVAAQQLYEGLGFLPYGWGKQEHYREFVAVLPLKS